MNLLETLAPQVRDRPDAPAIIVGPADRPRVTTFAELDRAAAQGRPGWRAWASAPATRC